MLITESRSSAIVGSAPNPSTISAALCLLLVYGTLSLVRASCQSTGGRLLTGERVLISGYQWSIIQSQKREILTQAKTWMNLTDLMRSEISQSQKDGFYNSV